jgi:glycosyltransferase involved in cell wall biosynthesis
METKTALIISTYNWPEALELSLKSVLNQHVLPDEIIVADDGSGEETGKLIQQFSKSISIPVKHVWQEDRGFRLSRIRNLAIKKSDCDYLIFTDGDIILHRNFVKDHIKTRRPHKFVTGSRVLLSKKESCKRIKNGITDFNFPFFSAKNRINAIRCKILSMLFSKTDNVIYNVRGCNMAFWKSDLVEVNGFDEQFSGWGREDSDIVFRLLKSGKTKFRLKFGAVQYHLFHKEYDRSSIIKNNRILSETISQNRVRAVIGLVELS